VIFVQEYNIDCRGYVLGRLSTKVAKLLLQGNKVNLFNAEELVISGHLKSIYGKYKHHIELQDKANPEHSPYWSRRPDFFVKRIVRGMLPYKKATGKAAYSRLKVYIGVPENFKDVKYSEIEAKKEESVFETCISIKELSGKLGYKI
jgi:large subunit ribosomal protein L13